MMRNSSIRTPRHLSKPVPSFNGGFQVEFYGLHVSKQEKSSTFGNLCEKLYIKALSNPLRETCSFPSADILQCGALSNQHSL